MVCACIEKRRRICGQESDGDGVAGENKKRKTEAEVVGEHQERLAGERTDEAQDRIKRRRIIRNIEPKKKRERMRKKNICSFI